MERNMRSLPFVPNSQHAGVKSSKTDEYLGALWEVLRVNVATLLVKEWMINLTEFPRVSICTPLENRLC